MTREEAIKIVKEFINGTCLHLVDQEALETLIPELKESKDERIRKGIISGMKALQEKGKYTFANIPVDNIFAWLERQGNLMKALQISNAQIGELVEENYYLKEQLEKQKEQKPAKWSKKDREMLYAMIDIVSNSLYEPIYPRDEMLSWLKSLRPQPKVEEEPEKVNCPFDKGDCRYCTVQFCGAREENHIETRSTAEPEYYQHFDPDC